MDWGGPGFILAIIMVTSGAWLLNNWIRAKHGYDLEDEWGGKTAPKDSAAQAELAQQVKRLADQVEQSNARIAALETIVTDKGYGVAQDIEKLRAERGNRDRGVPLDIVSNRETAK